MQARRTKHYLVIAPAGVAAATAPVAANPARIAVLVQNTGINVGALRFGGPPLNDGSDIAIGAGAHVLWDKCDTVPTDTLNFFSAGGTSFAVVETVGG